MTVTGHLMGRLPLRRPDWMASAALVPAALHHRLRAYAGLSEMTVPAYILTVLANAVPLAPSTNPQRSPPGAGDGTDPDHGLNTAPSQAASTPDAPDDHPTPAPAPPAPEGGDPHA